MQIVEQWGLPKEKSCGRVRIAYVPALLEKAILLRGVNAKENFRVATISFSTNKDRDCYLKNAIRAITEELFTGEGELKVGQMCGVRDDEDEPWKGRKLLAILPARYKERYIVETADYPDEHSSWKKARPIKRHTAPKIEECGQLITCVWKDNDEA